MTRREPLAIRADVAQKLIDNLTTQWTTLGQKSTRSTSGPPRGERNVFAILPEVRSSVRCWLGGDAFFCPPIDGGRNRRDSMPPNLFVQSCDNILALTHVRSHQAVASFKTNRPPPLPNKKKQKKEKRKKMGAIQGSNLGPLAFS